MATKGLAEGQRPSGVARVGLQPPEQRLKGGPRGRFGLGFVDSEFLGDLSERDLREQLVDL